MLVHDKLPVETHVVSEHLAVEEHNASSATISCCGMDQPEAGHMDASARPVTTRILSVRLCDVNMFVQCET